jgi:hypothetical protein
MRELAWQARGSFKELGARRTDGTDGTYGNNVSGRIRIPSS